MLGTAAAFAYPAIWSMVFKAVGLPEGDAEFLAYAATPIALVLLSVVFIRMAGATVFGKRVSIYITGDGCILCRELRRLAPAFPMSWGAMIVITDMLPNFKNFGFAAFVLGLCWLAFHGFEILRRDDAYWDRKTGFTVTF